MFNCMYVVCSLDDIVNKQKKEVNCKVVTLCRVVTSL